MNVKNIELLIGKTFSKIDKVKDLALIFEADNGYKVQMYHSQDCCESVTLEDVCGDLNDLLGSPILVAEERSCNDRDAEGVELQKKYPHDSVDCYTWTFYEIKTIKGSVTLRWYGESNGYYSESVDFAVVPEGAVKNAHTGYYNIR